MRTKKGVAGKTIITVFAIIAIAGILLAFVLVSGFVKMFSNANKGISVESGEDVGILAFGDYMNSSGLVENVNFRLASGDNLNDVLVSYFEGKVSEKTPYVNKFDRLGNLLGGGK